MVAAAFHKDAASIAGCNVIGRILPAVALSPQGGRSLLRLMMHKQVDEFAKRHQPLLRALCDLCDLCV